MERKKSLKRKNLKSKIDVLDNCPPNLSKEKIDEYLKPYVVQIKRDECTDYLVSTIFLVSTGLHETYISNHNGKGVVETYESRDAAQKGHEYWLRLVKTDKKFDPSMYD